MKSIEGGIASYTIATSGEYEVVSHTNNVVRGNVVDEAAGKASHEVVVRDSNGRSVTFSINERRIASKDGG